MNRLTTLRQRMLMKGDELIRELARANQCAESPSSTPQQRRAARRSAEKLGFEYMLAIAGYRHAMALTFRTPRLENRR